MSTKKKYVEMAIKYVEKLESNPTIKNCYVCLEAAPCFTGEDKNPLYYLHYRFAHLDIGHITNIPSIPLPNGNHFFYCTCQKQTLINLLKTEEGAESFRAESWEDLFVSDYEYWNYVFIAMGKRRSLSGDMVHYRGSFSELVPGDILEKHHVTGLFTSHSTTVPEMSLSDAQREKYIPSPPGKDDNHDGIDPTLYHYFLIDNFGISLDGGSHQELPCGLQWWPSSCFPSEGLVLYNSVANQSISEHQTFTGVLLVPVDPRANSHEEKQVAYQKLQKQVKRVRTYLDVFYSAKMRLLGDIQIVNGTHGLHRQRVNIGSPYPYRCWSDPPPVSKACFSSLILINAIEFAFTETTKKGLLKYLHRSIDSLDLARSLASDPLLAHIIVWAAIEALLSPSNKAELISNISLCLIGLQPGSLDKMELWDQAKKSYQMRSNIVHSFDIPEQEELEQSLGFAEQQCLNVLQFALTEPFPKGWTRDELASFLRERALA